ncbi:very short patch repair endonuclease [Halomonas sp. MCCC 1A11062]|uniref:very short patch repair endonuclease n=1 Tax=Halomonas sp. MCCC 1A11062 TaxID=2733485 RepID=UPI001F22CA44|nr:very short patch repair endonuclease [Halomonas sp. MCCC 1A11062]MCE8036374.1 DNA mismatch endonuclease Vsr [Halomonas sp. MCCC 1A11062]
MDTRTPEQRRKIMQAVKSKNTGPELIVRRALFALGYRFRLHRRNLPGSPDIVFPGRKKVIFVHGCFWHGHDCKRGAAPKSREDFWNEKLQKNRQRDKRNREELARLGWRTYTVWECEIKDLEGLLERLRKFLTDG